MTDDDGNREPPDPKDYPTLVATVRFIKSIPTLSWFDNLAAPFDGDLLDDARAYLAALGFPEAAVAPVANWHDAASAIADPDWNSAWWEVEEQMRASLAAAAVETVGREDFAAAMTHLDAAISETIPEMVSVAAAYGGVSGKDVVAAAMDAAAQACHGAALVLLAAAEDHPMALKYQLFEAGRWPLGVIGNTFHLF